MEPEVMMPSPAVDFNFDSACTSPYISCPSSPQPFGNFFFSAPTSPTRAASISGSADPTGFGVSASNIPYDWEDNPRIDKEFEFNFGGQFEKTSLSADELFDGGKIKPLKPPPQFQLADQGINNPLNSPRSSGRNFREALSPRRKKKHFDPLEQNPEQHKQQERGRERAHNSLSSSSNFKQRGSRSLSPSNVCDIFFEIEGNHGNSSSSNLSSSSFWTSSWRRYKKWRLKDLLLFRSASEGRARSRDSMKNKYSLLKRTSVEEVRNSSFRSTDSAVLAESSRRRGEVSAHELHYTMNRAVSEEMRKKTFLPYKHGLLGCLAFNPTVHDFSRELHSVTRG